MISAFSQTFDYLHDPSLYPSLVCALISMQCKQDQLFS